MTVRSERTLSTPRAGSAPPVLAPSEKKAKDDVSSKLNCICRLQKNNDIKLTILCSQCKNLHHLHCVHLTVRTAKKTTFICRNCKTSSISSSQPSRSNAPPNSKSITRHKAPGKQNPTHKKVQKPVAPPASTSSIPSAPNTEPLELPVVNHVLEQTSSAIDQSSSSYPNNHHCSTQSGLESVGTNDTSDKQSLPDNQTIPSSLGGSTVPFIGPANSCSHSDINHHPNSENNSPYITRACALKLINKIESSLRAEMNLRLISLENHVDRLNNEIKVLKHSCSNPAFSSHPAFHQFPSRPPPHPSRHPPSYPPRHPVLQPSRRPVPPVSTSHLPFRVIWGTPRNCSSSVIFKAISALLDHSTSESIMVKRSIRQRAHKSVWWFTIMAPPDTMHRIEEVWPTLQSKTAWNLKTSLSSHQHNMNHCPVSVYSRSTSSTSASPSSLAIINRVASLKDHPVPTFNSTSMPISAPSPAAPNVVTLESSAAISCLNATVVSPASLVQLAAGHVPNIPHPSPVTLESTAAHAPTRSPAAIPTTYLPLAPELVPAISLTSDVPAGESYPPDPIPDSSHVQISSSPSTSNCSSQVPVSSSPPTSNCSSEIPPAVTGAPSPFLETVIHPPRPPEAYLEALAT